MPNWKLTETARNIIKERADVLMQRRMRLALTDFPLDVEMVQRAIVRQDHLQMLRELENNEVDTLPQTRRMEVRVVDAALPRAVVLALTLNTDIFYTRTCGAYYGTKWAFDPSKDGHITKLNLASLSIDTRAALIKWINNVVRERRLEQLVTTTIDRMLFHALPTVGHIHVRWPELSLLVSENPTWRACFAEKPTRPGLYAWPSGVPNHPHERLRAELAKNMKATDIALAGASLMCDVDPTKQPVQARLEAWQSLPGDFMYEKG